MALLLSKLNLGKVDGKHEYLTPKNDRDESFYDAFLVPESVDVNRLNNGDIFFIEGFRGTGKTSLLRWYAEQCRRDGSVIDFILFKSDIPEAQRMGLSNEAGVTWTDVDSRKMEISQDFKAAWAWFIHHKIGELVKSNPSITRNGAFDRYIHLLGLNDPGIFSKVLGFLPKIEGAKIKIKSDLEFFETELEGEFKTEGKQGYTTLDALVRKLNSIVPHINVGKPIFIFFDELEVFYDSLETYHRDQRMIRDLLFSIASINELFRKHDISIHIIGAVRSEVIDGLGAIGQEVDRLVHDRGVTIAWHYAKRSLNHPLFEIVRNKILISEKASDCHISGDPINRYFPATVNGQPIDAFILDKSFYKPRDIVWRLTIAQKQFPKESKFTQDILLQTETEYSSKLWDEIKYELSATYSANEISAIEMVLSGGNPIFTIQHMEDKFTRVEAYSSYCRNLLGRRSVREILSDLYRLGAVGNMFRAGPSGTDILNRWAFRGDPELLWDKQMTLHPGLAKRLSLVPTRKRGAKGKGTDRSY